MVLSEKKVLHHIRKLIPIIVPDDSKLREETDYLKVADMVGEKLRMLYKEYEFETFSKLRLIINDCLDVCRAEGLSILSKVSNESAKIRSLEGSVETVSPVPTLTVSLNTSLQNRYSQVASKRQRPVERDVDARNLTFETFTPMQDDNLNFIETDNASIENLNNLIVEESNQLPGTEINKSIIISTSSRNKKLKKSSTPKQRVPVVSDGLPTVDIFTYSFESNSRYYKGEKVIFYSEKTT